MIKDDFWTAEFGEFDFMNSLQMCSIDDEAYIIVNATHNDWHAGYGTKDLVPIAMTPREWAHAVEQWIEQKAAYFVRYDSLEVGVGSVVFNQTFEEYLTVRHDGELLHVPIVQFDYVQMERG